MITRLSSSVRGRFNHVRATAAAVATMMIAGLSGTAWGDEYYFSNPLGGNWSDPANFTSVPNNFYYEAFLLPLLSPYIVNFDYIYTDQVYLDFLIMDGGGPDDPPAVTLRQADPTSVMRASVETIGRFGYALYDQSAGQNVAGALALGFTAGSFGEYRLSGGSLRTGVIRVGDEEGGGSLAISHGATISSDNAYIGASSSGEGTATVDGAGSSWTVFNIIAVGDESSGDNVLSITNGGRVTSLVGVLGLDSGAEGVVNVNGAGSTWTLSDIFFGVNGYGTLNITDGGAVIGGGGFLGYYNRGWGSVTVDGAGSSWTNSDNLTVGGEGAAALTITSGGLVSVGKTLTLGARGTINLNGGTLRVADTVNTAGGSFNFVSGRLEFTGNQMLDGGGLIEPIMNPNAGALTLGKTIAVNGTATLAVPLALDGGTFAVGALENAALLQFNRGTLALTGLGLTVGVGGPFGSTLEVSANQRIDVTREATVSAEGMLSIGGHGTLSAAGLTNNGEIELTDPTARLSAGWLSNNGLLVGAGRIDAPLHNTGEVRAGAGGRLVFSAGGNVNDSTLDAVGGRIDFLGDLVNDGNVSVIGGTLKVAGAAVNSHDGLIGGGNALMQFDQWLVNLGQLSFTTGASNVIGDIDNNLSGRIGVGGSSTVSVYGDLHNDGIVQVLAGSTAIILGDASGAGSYGGLGNVEFLGGFSPGNSPAEVHFNNDVTLGGGVTLIELGGLVAGDKYDKIVVSGELTLGAGVLDVVLLDGFTPQAGDTFDILDWGALEGHFGQIRLPGGYDWDTDRLYQTGILSVVPEPASTTLLLASGITLARRRRRTHSPVLLSSAPTARDDRT